MAVPQVVGWQVFDPATGAFLKEGEWVESRDPDLRLELPEGDGPYQIRVAPVQDRSRFIRMDVRVESGIIHLTPPQVASAAAEARGRLFAAIPKAFVLPVRSVWNHRRLIGSMVRRDILARYRGSFAGALWTILNPLLLMATYFFVFGVVLNARFGNDTSRSGFVLYFLAGMLPWMAFSEAVGRSPSVVLEHRNFVKKLVFPLETLPVNLVISGVVTEGIGLVIFAVGLLVLRGSVPATVVWLPLVLAPQLLFTAGMCWFLAALGVFARDLGQIMGFLLTLWFFLTPICYPETQHLPEAVATMLSFNPIYILVRSYRAILLEHSAPPLRALAALWAASGALAILGHGWFHRLRRSFADVI